MRAVFSFSYELHRAGWSSAILSDGEQNVSLVASYISDALGDLTRAVLALLHGAEGATFTWLSEPGVDEWRVARQGDDVDIVVTVFNDDRRFKARRGEVVFSMRCPLTRLANEVLDELWRLLETVGMDGYKERWQAHDFPLTDYKQLRELLRDRAKRQPAR